MLQRKQYLREGLDPCSILDKPSHDIVQGLAMIRFEEVMGPTLQFVFFAELSNHCSELPALELRARAIREALHLLDTLVLREDLRSSAFKEKQDA
eukprot:gene25192-biopygen10469